MAEYRYFDKTDKWLDTVRRLFLAAGDPGGGKAIDTSAPKIASSSLAIKFAKEPEKYDRCNGWLMLF